MTTLNPTRIKHLCRRQETEPGHITRYVGFCGTTGTASRDYLQNVTRNGKQIVTCTRCLSVFRPPKAEKATNKE